PRAQRIARVVPSDEGADNADHLQNLGDAPLVEGVDGVAAPNQLAGDVGLEVGEREHEIRLQRLDLVESGIDEGRDLRLLPGFGRAAGIARDADHTIPFAEQIQRLGRLLRQADDAGWIPWHWEPRDCRSGRRISSRNSMRVRASFWNPPSIAL